MANNYNSRRYVPTAFKRRKTSMASAVYHQVDKKFLDTFYRECGRELTLAYTVLNQANTWAITFFAASLGSSFLGLIKHTSDGGYSIDYPNSFYWLFLIVVW